MNPFQATDLFLYLLKTSENQRFSDAFRGIERDRGMKWVDDKSFPPISSVKVFC